MLQGFFAAFSEVSQCYMVAAVTLLGTWIFLTKPSWCDNTIGKLAKSKCDRTKKILFAVLSAFVALVAVRNVMPGMGGYSSGMGGGYMY